jgi:hypothetical protein
VAPKIDRTAHNQAFDTGGNINPPEWDIQQRFSYKIRSNANVLFLSLATSMYALFALLVATVCVAGYFYLFSQPTAIYATTRQTIEDLLDPVGADETAKLESRALPNARLVPAFEINSTFVSNSPHLHQTFVNETKGLLRQWYKDWDRFAEIANMVVAKYLKPVQSSPEGSGILPFDSFVQAVTLATVMISFFQTDLELLDFDDVVFVARAINDRWKQSKKCPKLSRDGLEEILVFLNRWAPSTPNALEYILPSFETMWRVVAITLAYEHHNLEAHSSCQELLQNPHPAQFKSQRGSYSVHDMIQESLRLHPPTKHISRAIPIQSPIVRVILGALGVQYLKRGVADVETCQRSSAWGPNPDIFNPARHSSEEVQLHPDAISFAFGYGSMQCVARNWAPHAAGILFSSIMHGVSPSSKVMIDHEGKIGGREGWEKWKITTSRV